MKKTILFFAFLLMVIGYASQAQQVYKYWVQFTDKNQSPYRLDNPAEFLGERALERRSRQAIAVDSLDLPVNPRYVEALQQQGCRVQNRSRWLNGVVAFVNIRPDDDSCGARFVRRVGELPFVKSVVLCDSAEASRPDTNLSSLGAFLHDFEVGSPYGPGYYGWGNRQIDQLRGQALHRAGFEGQGIVIGVCDCGFPGVDTIALLEPLRREGRLLATRDFVWDRENDVFSVHPHGTHCLGTMAAAVPGRCVGTAPKASYVLCRTENVLSENVLEEYNWAAAAEWLDSLGADIISTSLGYFNYDDTSTSYSLRDLDGATAPISRAAGVAVSRGMLVLNSAGNDGRSVPQHLNVPADVESVLTVGAVDSLGLRAPFSSHGPTATACVKPDVMALGVQVVTLAPDGNYNIGSGTSLACPIMAGMMACLWQRYPVLTPLQLCDSVRAWGNRASQPDSTVGYGMPDFGRAMRSLPSGVHGLEADGAGLSLFPNPAARGVQARLSYNSPVSQVEVYDVWGRSLFRCIPAGGFGQMLLPRLNSGLYLVRVVTAQGTARLFKLQVGRQ